MAKIELLAFLRFEYCWEEIILLTRGFVFELLPTECINAAIDPEFDSASIFYLFYALPRAGLNLKVV